MVTVLIVMLVLTIGGMALSAIVLSSSGTIVDSRSLSAAQAEVDGAITMQSVKLMQGEISCNTLSPTNGTVRNGNSPVSVDWTLTCSETGASGTAVIEATAVVDGASAAREAVFAYTPLREPVEIEDVVFYDSSDVQLNPGTTIGTRDAPMNLLIPEAGLDCKAIIWGNVTAKGDIKLGSQCEIHGTVMSLTGAVMLSGGVIDGDVKVGGTAASQLNGPVSGNVWAAGNVSVGDKISGDLTVDGKVALNGEVVGTVTVPTPASTNLSGNRNYGALVETANVQLPFIPQSPPWVDFTFAASEWPGYEVVTLSKSGSGYTSCSGWEKNGSQGWNELASFDTNTVIDARACATLDASKAGSPISLAQDTLILGNGFDLQKSHWAPAGDATAEAPVKVWFVTEDSVANSDPTCSPGQGETRLFQVGFDPAVNAMAYTPCEIKMGSGSTPWRGSIYGGSFDKGAKQHFEYGNISLPGFSGAGGSESGPAEMTEITLEASRPTK